MAAIQTQWGPDGMAESSWGRADGPVLLVDGDPVVLRILEVLVGSLGYHTDSANCVDEAVPLLVYRDYAAAVCGNAEPPEQYALYEACRARRPDMARRLIFLIPSGRDDCDTEQLRQTGQPSLVAPCRTEELRHALQLVTA